MEAPEAEAMAFFVSLSNHEGPRPTGGSSAAGGSSVVVDHGIACGYELRLQGHGGQTPKVCGLISGSAARLPGCSSSLGASESKLVQ